MFKQASMTEIFRVISRRYGKKKVPPHPGFFNVKSPRGTARIISLLAALVKVDNDECQIARAMFTAIMICTFYSTLSLRSRVYDGDVINRSRFFFQCQRSIWTNVRGTAISIDWSARTEPTDTGRPT